MTATIDKNGRWIDDDRPAGTQNTRCPKCGRDSVVSTVSTEVCTTEGCTYFFDYWGGQGR